MGDYLYDKMLPQLYEGMKNAGEEMIPYVEFRDRMEDGVYAFYDKPRFSSGYAALYHSIPFVIETHMLKPLHAEYRRLRCCCGRFCNIPQRISLK